MLSFRILAFLYGGKTRLQTIKADSLDEAWGLATRWASRLDAVTFQVTETGEATA